MGEIVVPVVQGISLSKRIVRTVIFSGFGFAEAAFYYYYKEGETAIYVSSLFCLKIESMGNYSEMINKKITFTGLSRRSRGYCCNYKMSVLC